MKKFAIPHFQIYGTRTENGAWAGRICCSRLEEPLFFGDISGLLLQIDALLDQWKLPRAYERKRRFGGGQPAPDTTYTGCPASICPHIPCRAFSLKISSRRNSGWQGVIDWQQGEKPQPFESELELLRMLARELSAT